MQLAQHGLVWIAAIAFSLLLRADGAEVQTRFVSLVSDVLRTGGEVAAVYYDVTGERAPQLARVQDGLSVSYDGQQLLRTCTLLPPRRMWRAPPGCLYTSLSVHTRAHTHTRTLKCRHACRANLNKRAPEALC